MNLREIELLSLFHNGIKELSNVEVLGLINQEHYGCVTFNIKNMHYNLVVRLLNDRFGIQVGGGWSCASTYSHCLLEINIETSESIMNQIEQKNLIDKPGWVRLSIHPTMSDEEIE